MASDLPRFAVLKHKEYYNTHVRCTEDGSIKIYEGKLDERNAWSPTCKLELERVETEPERYVHIRSCYNNKYWARDGPNSTSLKACAAQPNEDKSSWKCTMFHFKAVGTTDIDLYLYNAWNQEYVRSYNVSFFLGGFCGSAARFHPVIDWESLVILPKHVTFKGDNGKYLAARWIEGHEYHKFDCSDLGDTRVAYEIFPYGDGCVRIKSKYFNKFWRRSTNWILADSSDKSDDNKDTLFMPVKVWNNTSTIALRNLGNKNFCVRLSKEGKENCLNADDASITHQAILTMEEVVLSREITNVRYRLNNARIYDENILTMVSREAFNYSSVPETVTIKLSYTQTSRKTWERGVAASVSVSTKIKAGIPFLADGKIQVKGTIGGHMKWGDTDETSKVVETTQTVTVPPRTRVKTSLLATEGTCDVPFSYTQRDVLFDGRVVTFQMDDGQFTGVNAYNFRFETTEHKL